MHQWQIHKYYRFPSLVCRCWSTQCAHFYRLELAAANGLFAFHHNVRQQIPSTVWTSCIHFLWLELVYMNSNRIPVWRCRLHWRLLRLLHCHRSAMVIPSAKWVGRMKCLSGHRCKWSSIELTIDPSTQNLSILLATVLGRVPSTMEWMDHAMNTKQCIHSLLSQAEISREFCHSTNSVCQFSQSHLCRCDDVFAHGIIQWPRSLQKFNKISIQFIQPVSQWTNGLSLTDFINIGIYFIWMHDWR